MTYCKEHDIGWLHGVLVGQTDKSMVDTTIEVCLRWTSDRKVPLERLIFQRLCINKDLLFGLDVAIFLHNATHGKRRSTSLADHIYNKSFLIINNL